MPKRSSLPLHRNLFFTTTAVRQAISDKTHTLNAAHFIGVGGSSDSPCLSLIHSFCEHVGAFATSHPSTPVVICPQDTSGSSLRNSCVLCGAYLLLHLEVDFDAVLDMFKDELAEMADNEQLSSADETSDIVDNWAALHRARQLQWLGTESSDYEPLLDVEMAAHYALAANGGIDVLVPGKLLHIPSPFILPDGCDWLDEATPGRSPSRRFSAAFLADLLSELGVSAAVCLAAAPDAAAGAFRARGLDAHDLRIDPRRPALLGALDRLLAISRAAPGPVAVFAPAADGGVDDCGGDGDSGVGGDRTASAAESARTLAAAWLVRDFGFAGAAAAAWVRMASPPAHPDSTTR
jgi:hypothetical protein